MLNFPKRIDSSQHVIDDMEAQAQCPDDCKAPDNDDEAAGKEKDPEEDHNWKKRRYDDDPAFWARQEQLKREFMRRKEFIAQQESLKQEMLEKGRQRQAQKQSLEHVIANAKKAAADEEAAAAAAIAEAKLKAEAAAEKAAKRKERAQKKASMTPQQKEALKEKRLLKLIGAVVVKCMSKYGKSLDRDSFKKYAKEVCHLFLFQPFILIWFLFHS